MIVKKYEILIAVKYCQFKGVVYAALLYPFLPLQKAKIVLGGFRRGNSMSTEVIHILLESEKISNCIGAHHHMQKLCTKRIRYKGA